MFPVHPPRLISATYVHRLWGDFRQSYLSHLNATQKTTPTKALLTAVYKQLPSWKEIREKKNSMRERSLEGLENYWSFEAMEEASHWLMKSVSVMASACDNSRILKAQTLLLHLMPSSWEQSGHYPTAFCYGRSLWFRDWSIISSTHAEPDRHVGRCVLSIMFASQIED